MEKNLYTHPKRALTLCKYDYNSEPDFTLFSKKKTPVQFSLAKSLISTNTILFSFKQTLI